MTNCGIASHLKNVWSVGVTGSSLWREGIRTLEKKDRSLLTYPVPLSFVNHCAQQTYLAHYLSVIYILEIYCVWNFLSWKTKNFNYLKRILYASLEVTIFLKKRNIMYVLLLLFPFFFFLQETLYYLVEHSEF